LDEEGFMQEIEKFTRQTIAVEKVEGFGPAPDERAEPIAMGRQTLWGGVGKPPSRDVMASAARAARQEMMERIREKKGSAPHNDSRNDSRNEARNDGPRSEPRAERGDRPARPPQAARPQGAHPGSRPPQPRRDRNDRGPRAPSPAHHQAHGGNDSQAPRQFEEDYQPRANAHLGTQSGVNAFGHKSGGGAGRQPDPTMTSVDLLSRNNRGGGGGGGAKRRSGGGGKPGGFGGGGAKRSGGGGYGR
jgi:ATP-dependent RNA helicase RhlE